MYKFPTIYLDKGGTSIVKIDLTNFDFKEGSLVFSMHLKNTREIIKEAVFTTPGVHNLIFECDFTKDLILGKDNYEYDFFFHIEGERFQQCPPSPIVVESTVGGKK